LFHFQIEGVCKLIDLDASAEIGSKEAGKKFSSGYAPPELINADFFGTQPLGGSYTMKPGAALLAHPTYDVWSFGVLAYLMVTGRSLFHNDQQDNLKPAQLSELKNWNAASLRVKMGEFKVDGEDLGQGQSSAKRLAEIAAQNTKLIVSIHSKVIELEKVSKKTVAQLERTKGVLLNGIFEATEVTCPSSFFISPVRLGGDDTGKGEGGFFKIAADGQGMDGSGIQLTAKGNAAKGWMDSLCSMGQSLVSGDVQGTAGAVAEVLTGMFPSEGPLAKKEMYLYLIDEYTGKPVVLENKHDDSYPIIIKTPSVNAKKWLPLMRSGLKVMDAVNSAAFVANCCGIPAPRVPKKWKQQAKEAVGALNKESTVSEFRVLQQSVDRTASSGSGEAETKEMLGKSLREFQRFLNENDPKGKFSGLNRVECEGHVCWTVLTKQELDERENDNRTLAREAGELRSSKVDLSERRIEIGGRVGTVAKTGSKTGSSTKHLVEFDDGTKDSFVLSKDGGGTNTPFYLLPEAAPEAKITPAPLQPDGEEHTIPVGDDRYLAKDLLMKLLEPNPTSRLQSFTEVLEHAFFAGSIRTDQEGLETIKAVLKTVKEQEEVQKRQQELLLVIESKVINIKNISDATYTKLRKTEQVLLHAMFEATEVTVPTSFLITAVLLKPAGAKEDDSYSLTLDPEALLPEDEGCAAGEEAEEDEAAEIQLSIKGKKSKLSSRGKKAKGWFEKSTAFFSSASKLASGDMEGAADDAVSAAHGQMVKFVEEELKDADMYLCKLPFPLCKSNSPCL
jgi:serine/threonine protein kinase